jgi:hypothetical protein
MTLLLLLLLLLLIIVPSVPSRTEPLPPQAGTTGCVCCKQASDIFPAAAGFESDADIFGGCKCWQLTPEDSGSSTAVCIGIMIRREV